MSTEQIEIIKTDCPQANVDALIINLYFHKTAYHHTLWFILYALANKQWLYTKLNKFQGNKISDGSPSFLHLGDQIN